MIATFALAALLLNVGVVHSQGLSGLFSGTSSSSGSTCTSTASTVYDLMKAITSFTDADVNALFAVGLNGVNSLPTTNPNLANKIISFNAIYDVIAKDLAAKAFIDKIFGYTARDRQNPAGQALSWSSLQQDFRNLSTTSCYMVVSKFPALCRLGACRV